MWRFALVCVLAAGSLPAFAEIRIELDASGRKVLTNTGETAPRRTPGLGRRVEARELGPLIDRYADHYALDPKLVHAVIRAESGYNTRAVSPKGARGLMQLMPATARELDVEDAFDPASNIAGGTRYLRRMLDQFSGSIELALAGYNAGPEAVRQFGGIPPFPETRRYVTRILRDYRGDGGYELPASETVRVGRKVYVSRDAAGRVLLTTVARR
jgi:soluble lytic murein transglycosylase-like protein